MPRSVRWPVLGIFSVLTVVPFLWLLMSSLKTSEEIFADPFGLPGSFSLGNFTGAWEAHPLGRFLLNSVVVAVVATALIIVASLLAAYALMYRFRISRAVLAFLVFGLLLPVNALLVPIFYVINDLRLYNSVWGVALTYAGIFFPTGFLIIKGYMDTTPEEILEAARMDGASFHRVFRSVVAPLTVPGVVTAAIFLLITTWNELLFATVLTQDEQAQTVQVGVRFFLTTYAANYPQAFAATVMSILPTILVYVVLSNRVIGGMTAGSLK
ncbi:carbohydrate ABC transporter permease [Actinoplanes sp. RD1]|uniref:carbohydrate ABC transporter permease n=1 Tax=Actinoplanes sp. RD1 TaxID=3064538 RepID=UPI0027413FB1|nr:carbohydrate ABC transporter permease [Actinoplanes sp. RD1]